MGQILDFSHGVRHNFFIYWPNVPKLHQQVSKDTSLDEDKENLRSRSKVKVKLTKTSIFHTVYRITFFIYRPNMPKLH